MGRPYSEDLRERVLSAVQGGLSVSEACRQFRVGRTSFYRWQNRHNEQGHCRALSLKGRPSQRRKIKDLAAFREFALQHSDKTQAEMAELWGESVNQQIVSRALAAVGITRKKMLALS